MKLARFMVAVGCVTLICGAADHVQSEGRPPLASILIVPAGSPVRLRTVSERDELAEFADRFVLSGRFRYGCTDECHKPFRREDMRLVFFPDAELSARLPHWRGYTTHPVIEIDNSAAFAAKVIPQDTMRRLQYGRLNWAEGRMSIVADGFRTGLACDSAWYSARFVEVAEPATFEPVRSESSGCE